MVGTPPPQSLQPRAGFVPVSSGSPFVIVSGTFFIRSEGSAGPTFGTWIGEEQADSEGIVDRGFLLTFADFALTEATNGITVNVSADCMATARVGDWIEATVAVRGESSTLIFADAVIALATGPPLMRVRGMFRPFKKRARPGEHAQPKLADKEA